MLALVTLHSHTAQGLGTNTAAEGKEYFKQIDRHRIPFVMSTKVPRAARRARGGNATHRLVRPVRQPQEDERLIDMAFNKDLADQRKTWLMGAGRVMGAER